MASNGDDEDLCEHFHGEAPDRGEEAGGFGVLLIQDMDLHFDVGNLGRYRCFRFLALC